jgi:hypothetical protein
MRLLALLLVVCIIYAYSATAALSSTKVQDEEVTSTTQAQQTETVPAVSHNLPTEAEGNVIMIDTMLTAARNEKQQRQGVSRTRFSGEITFKIKITNLSFLRALLDSQFVPMFN